jgi:GTPase SAR1 family protein
MGPAGVGKTSLMLTTCQGFPFLRVMNLPPTRGISRENYLFRGLLEINIWDAGGQEKYLERYFSETQRGVVFSEIKLPIILLDSTGDAEVNKAQVELFTQIYKAIFEFSPEVKKIYVLINKCDLPNANPDGLYNLLVKELSKDQLKRFEFTPVSVKLGSAQHRLIEILDYILQESALEMQKSLQLRGELKALKERTGCEFFLFHSTDGLLITSTLGMLDTEPLLYMPISAGSLESNIDLISQKIRESMGLNPSALLLTALIYQTDTNYLVMHEIGGELVLVGATQTRESAELSKLIALFNDTQEPFAKLMKLLGDHRI